MAKKIKEKELNKVSGGIPRKPISFTFKPDPIFQPFNGKAYKCEECGEIFNVEEGGETTCPKCGSKTCFEKVQLDQGVSK